MLLATATATAAVRSASALGGVVGAQISHLLPLSAPRSRGGLHRGTHQQKRTTQLGPCG